MTEAFFSMVFMQIPFVITLRDGKNRTLLGNCALAKLAGLKKIKQLEGLSDVDAPWHAYAEIYGKQDQDALNGIVYRQFEPVMTAEGYKVLLIQKIPLKNKFQGMKVVLGIAIEITEREVLSTLHLIEGQSPLEQRKVFVISNLSYIKEKFPDSKFTDKDIECIYYVLRGRSAKVIANYFHCSPKTIEARIDHLRLRFECSSKQMLIEKLTTLGFRSMIPESILHCRLGYIEQPIKQFCMNVE